MKMGNKGLGHRQLAYLGIKVSEDDPDATKCPRCPKRLSLASPSCELCKGYGLVGHERAVAYRLAGMAGVYDWLESRDDSWWGKHA